MFLGMARAAEINLWSLPDPTRPYRPPTVTGERPPTATYSSEPSLGLEFTYISVRQRSAVINGKRYHVGDKIAGYHVTLILPNEVRLTKNGATRILNTTRPVITPREEAPD